MSDPPKPTNKPRPSDPPLEVKVPKTEPPQAWSRVGVVAAIGFVAGVLWPKLLGVRVGPAVPGEGKPETSASPSAAAPLGSGGPPLASASAAPGPAPTGSAAAAEGLPNKQRVTVGPGKITRCSDKRGEKLESCGELLFDPVAKPRLEALAKCPAALGLSGKVNLNVDINFERKDVAISKAKKNPLPGSTVQGLVGCAAREFASTPFAEIPHDHKRYTIAYALTFHPPGKEAQGDGDASDGDPALGKTTSEAQAGGSATVVQDTALIRSEPKDGKVAFRLVRGTKVKIVGRQNDWYHIEHGSKQGWVYRGAIGL